eukprot:COSAG02_NODE_17532_length_997_cov_1.566815_2_plen_33_part_00
MRVSGECVTCGSLAEHVSDVRGGEKKLWRMVE